MELAPQPGSPDFTVMAALTQMQAQWTAPQIAVFTELPLSAVISACGRLRREGLVDVVVWMGLEPVALARTHLSGGTDDHTLHELTDAGRERFMQIAQLQIEGLH